MKFRALFYAQIKAVYLLDTWADTDLQALAQGAIPLQLRNGLSALRVLRVIRLLRVVRFIHARLFLNPSMFLSCHVLPCTIWLLIPCLKRFGIRTVMVYLETLHGGFYPFITFSMTFFLFIYICAILGQQLFSGEFNTCSNNFIVVREKCNSLVWFITYFSLMWCEWLCQRMPVTCFSSCMKIDDEIVLDQVLVSARAHCSGCITFTDERMTLHLKFSNRDYPFNCRIPSHWTLFRDFIFWQASQGISNGDKGPIEILWESADLNFDWIGSSIITVFVIATQVC